MRTSIDVTLDVTEDTPYLLADALHDAVDDVIDVYDLPDLDVDTVESLDSLTRVPVDERTTRSLFTEGRHDVTVVLEGTPYAVQEFVRRYEEIFH